MSTVSPSIVLKSAGAPIASNKGVLLDPLFRSTADSPMSSDGHQFWRGHIESCRPARRTFRVASEIKREFDIPVAAFVSDGVGATIDEPVLGRGVGLGMIVGMSSGLARCIASVASTMLEIRWAPVTVTPPFNDDNPTCFSAPRDVAVEDKLMGDARTKLLRHELNDPGCALHDSGAAARSVRNETHSFGPPGACAGDKRLQAFRLYGLS
ncbi:hypothetical protein [Mesorhizobium retamae]|uniref:Uncharacterized protein n=1 Tax=Mesorhizobium retamae TaxID=2912854 RepID=A0ABS9QLZ0_9HYPH|nr:hypothetical protein [Mesorhizobium sp. IRAMC:0171]MCG7508437.1 hypothetical protein [Mesorhizobium sp. IRAMC:0171]